MKKLILRAMLMALLFFNSLNLLAQENKNGFGNNKNAFRLGLNYTTNGSHDEISLMYQNEYQRKLNKYFELGFGVGFFNYIYYWDEPNVSELQEIIETTSIVSFDLVVNLLVMDFKRHFFKIGAGYSLRKVKSTHFKSSQDFYDAMGNILTIINYKKVDGFDGGVIVHLEYGFRISPRFATSVSGRYYGEGQYVSLAMAGINFYYSF